MIRLLRLENGWTRRSVTGLLMLHLFAVILLAGLGDLHKLAHPDAGHADHHCLVTLYAKGGVDGPAAAAVVVVCLGLLLPRRIQPHSVRLGSLFLSRSILEHAPPRA